MLHLPLRASGLLTHSRSKFTSDKVLDFNALQAQLAVLDALGRLNAFYRFHSPKKLQVGPLTPVRVSNLCKPFLESRSRRSASAPGWRCRCCRCDRLRRQFPSRLLLPTSSMTDCVGRFFPALSALLRPQQDLRIIVGRGARSATPNQPVVRDAVLRFLQV